MPLEHTPPPHHQQIFDDHAQEDAAMKKWEHDDGWIAWFLKNLGSTLQRLGISK